MDEAETWRRRILNAVLVPVGLLLLIPLALLFTAWFYMAATVEGVRHLASALRRTKQGNRSLQKPHFAETRREVPHHPGR